MTNLLSRLLDATDPDRELDTEIAVLVDGGEIIWKQATGTMESYPVRKYASTMHIGGFGYAPVPRYTESLDAAMTLLPIKWKWTLISENVATICQDWDDDYAPVFWSQHPDKRRTSWSSAKGTVANPATAFTIACLKARKLI